MTDPERRRIEDLCDAALDRDPSERAAFVAAACGQDDALRREVESLLANATRAEGFLVTPVDNLAAQILGDEHETLLAGHQLGPYRILALLGAGGMGEVYRALDTRLHREVAVKVVSGPFLATPERLARFELEARVLATLNHPHIGAIYGVEEADGVRGLILELVEGTTLAERLSSGPLPVPEALAVSRQIVDALDAAHEKGIVHRDLKPANITITPNGTVKVLDFGLAKVFAREAEGDGALPRSVEASQAGVILGTASYMSPEQARGKPVDKRTDVWAFGCVMYEMLTARPAFDGQTTSDTIAAILEHEPDWTLLPPPVPPPIRRLLQRCLAKDPKHRLHDIADARLDIDEAGVGPAVPARPARRAWWIAAGVSVLALASAAAWALWRTDDSWRNPLDGAKVTKVTDFEGAEHHAAISRDGKFVAFLSERDGTWDAWISQLGTGEAHNLTKGEVRELRNPATRTLGFSPDGSLVTLWSRVADADGGAMVEAGRAVPTMGGPLRPYLKGVSELDWSDDGRRIVYHPAAEGDPLFVTEPDEKVGRQIYVARPGFHNHFPLWSHDGAFIYFVHGLALERSDIWRIRPTGGPPERMTFHDTRVTFPTLLGERTLLYLATDDDGYGPWIYAVDLERRATHRISTGVEQYASLAASQDGRRLIATVSRSAARLWRVPIATHAADESAATAIPLPTASGVSPRLASGSIIYRAPKAGSEGVWKLTPNGTATELWNGVNGRAVAAPAVAPDGRRLAFLAQQQGMAHLYVANTDGTDTRRLAEGLDVRGSPTWSPDGRWLAVAADHQGEPQLFKIPVDGGAPVRLVAEYSTDPAWSPDGGFLVYSGADVGTTFPIKAVTADGAPHHLPSLTLTRGARRLAFLNEHTLVVMKGDVSQKDFWSVDLRTGHDRRLTNLGRGFVIGDFDVSPNGREIIFDRVREESDIVLFELPDRASRAWR
jgi:Tol biopolymer transport system component